jgi:DNA uptake protein ComE-like DNA-binding protein
MKKFFLLLVTVLFAATMLAAQGKAEKQTSKSSGMAAQSSTASKSSAASKTAGEKLDINTASKDELEKLPGIGPVTSQKIIDGRPYRAKNELVSKKIVSKSEYDKIKDQIIAHQTTGMAKKSKSK